MLTARPRMTKAKSLKPNAEMRYKAKVRDKEEAEANSKETGERTDIQDR